MYDFKLVAVLERGFCPGCTGDDFAIVFDGYPVVLEAENLDQVGDFCVGFEVRKLFRLAVND